MIEVGPARATLIWGALAAAITVPVGLAAVSPLLAWRDPMYVASGFAGVVASALLLLQPLLAKGSLPGLQARRGRRLHAIAGVGLVMAVVAHVVGLWLTSPPDVIDALLLRSPTPFSGWGVVAMWAVSLAALLAALRRRLRLRLRVWRAIHLTLAMVIISGSVVHAMLIDGTMEGASKAALCALILAAGAKVVADLRSRSLVVQQKA